MHLTFHTNSRGCWKPRLATHIFSPSVSLCCSLRLNWSSRSDNLALSVLISSQACLSVTDWSQMALLRGDNSSFYQTGPQQHANLKTLNLKSRGASWKWLCDVKEIMDLSTWMLPGSANLHAAVQAADVHATSHVQAEADVGTTAAAVKCKTLPNRFCTNRFFPFV